MDSFIRQQMNLVNNAINNTVAAYVIWAKKNGLNHNSLMVIYTIGETVKCTQKNLSDILLLPKSTVHSILLDFVKKGYLTLEIEPGNKKEKIICPTKEGEIFFSEIRSKLNALEDRTLQKLDKDMCEQLVASNLAFCDAFSKEVENE